MDSLQNLLQSDTPILLDGAMGTMLMDAGLDHGDPPEAWNTLHPERVRKIHHQYIKAGSQIILTNSFGGTCYRLALHNLSERVFELNKAAAENARAEADAASRAVWVAGSMGPTGQMMEPVGEISFEDARDAFAEQASGLEAGGVDLFWIETMSDLNEVKAAVAGIRRVSQLPISATMSFDTHGHTMMGISPARAVEELQQLDLVSVGANCGTGSDELIQVISAMQETDPDLPLVAKANAGIPEVVDGSMVYNGTPDLMADYAREVRRQGAKLIGACCGSTPEHIQAMAEALKEMNK
ncbi:MAG: betaine--homocysteine S-methyltransferase [Anaerolineales bacterium]